MSIPFNRLLAFISIGFVIVSGNDRTADGPAPKPLTVPPLQFEKYKLANGLEVILHENHRLPLVAVDVWYHVGPANKFLIGSIRPVRS